MLMYIIHPAVAAAAAVTEAPGYLTLFRSARYVCVSYIFLTVVDCREMKIYGRSFAVDDTKKHSRIPFHNSFHLVVHKYA
jgi:hypothetical protein